MNDSKHRMYPDAPEQLYLVPNAMHSEQYGLFRYGYSGRCRKLQVGSLRDQQDPDFSAYSVLSAVAIEALHDEQRRQNSNKQIVGAV